MGTDRDREHRRYDSDEFDYAGCVVCDANGDTLGWPCPTVAGACDYTTEAFDVDNGPHWRRCDQPTGHDGEHHPAIVVEA